MKQTNPKISLLSRPRVPHHLGGLFRLTIRLFVRTFAECKRLSIILNNVIKNPLSRELESLSRIIWHSLGLT